MPGVTRWYQNTLSQMCDQPVTTAHQPEFLRAATAHSDAMRPRCIVIGQTNAPVTPSHPSRELLPLYDLAQLFVAGMPPGMP